MGRRGYYAGQYFHRARRGAAAPPAYDPATEPGSVFFYDASSTDNVVVSPGATFSQFADRTGNARHGTQATAAKRPAAVTLTLGGKTKRYARFDGVDDAVSITLGELVGQTTMSMYFVVANGPVGLASKYLYDQNPPRLLAAVGTDVAGNLGAFDGTWRNPGGTAVATAALQLLCFEFNGAASQLKVFRDGAQVGATVGYSPQNFLAAGGMPHLMSAFGGLGPFTAIDLGVAYFNSTTRANHDSAAVEAALRSDWGTP